MRQKQRWKDRNEHVIDALLRMDDETASSLALKVSECRRKWDGRFRCREPVCGWCRRLYQRQQSRSLIAECQGLDNQDLGFLSVVAAGTDSIDGIDPIVASLKRGARNRLDGLRRDNFDLWGSTALRCWIEIDALAGDQIPLLGSSRGTLLPEIAPLVIDNPNPVWIIGCHGLVVLGEAGRERVSQAFSEQWPVVGQVDLRPLDEAKAVEANIEKIVGYSTKFATATQFGAIKEPWPWPWQAEIFRKFGEKRNAFEYCRFGIGPATILQSSQECCNELDVLIEPMPFVHSVIIYPVSYITGPDENF